MFSRELFAAAFAISIDALAQSEHVTKRELRGLSRTVLEATHETGDIQFANKLVAILTPVNKRVCVLFFKAFLGFIWDDKLMMFTKKSKKKYDEAHKAYAEFMADPNNNIWTWAERNVDIEPKAFDLTSVTKYVESALKKAADAQLNQADVMRAIIKAGITADTIIACMDELGFDVKEEQQEQQG